MFTMISVWNNGTDCPWATLLVSQCPRQLLGMVYKCTYTCNVCVCEHSLTISSEFSKVSKFSKARNEPDLSVGEALCFDKENLEKER